MSSAVSHGLKQCHEVIFSTYMHTLDSHFTATLSNSKVKHSSIDIKFDYSEASLTCYLFNEKRKRNKNNNCFTFTTLFKQSSWNRLTQTNNLTLFDKQPTNEGKIGSFSPFANQFPQPFAEEELGVWPLWILPEEGEPFFDLDPKEVKSLRADIFPSKSIFFHLFVNSRARKYKVTSPEEASGRDGDERNPHSTPALYRTRHPPAFSIVPTNFSTGSRSSVNMHNVAVVSRWLFQKNRGRPKILHELSAGWPLSSLPIIAVDRHQSFFRP